MKIVLAVLIWMTSPALGDTPETSESPQSTDSARFLRLVEDKTGHAKLEAAIVTFQRGDVTVDLVSAIHVAEHSYYDDLNRRFAQYETVLYEMVKPKGMKPLSPEQMAQANRGGISVLHRIMQRATQLAFQMDVVDYTPAHFVHADLDWATFAEAMQQSNELTGILLRSYASAAAGEQTSSVRPEVLMGQFLLAMSDPAEARALKYMLAQEFSDIEKSTQALQGPDGGVLLGRRNQAAIEALQTVLEQGKKRIALFYGAAHMPDLGQRLKAIGFEPKETKWLTAWDIPAAPTTQPAQ